MLIFLIIWILHKKMARFEIIKNSKRAIKSKYWLKIPALHRHYYFIKKVLRVLPSCEYVYHHRLMPECNDIVHRRFP